MLFFCFPTALINMQLQKVFARQPKSSQHQKFSSGPSKQNKQKKKHLGQTGKSTWKNVFSYNFRFAMSFETNFVILKGLNSSVSENTVCIKHMVCVHHVPDLANFATCTDLLRLNSQTECHKTHQRHWLTQKAQMVDHQVVVQRPSFPLCEAMTWRLTLL